MAIDNSYFHVGIVVPDLDAAKAHLGELLGLTWGNLSEVPATDVRDGDGAEFQVDIRCVYSREQPYIELIQEQPGTIWECNEHSNLHHIGLWSDTIVDDSVVLGARRCPLALGGRDGAIAPHQWCYHRDPLGFNLELIDSATRELSQRYMFGPPVG